MPATKDRPYVARCRDCTARIKCVKEVARNTWAYYHMQELNHSVERWSEANKKAVPDDA